jgi:hypothetical protein
MILDLLSAGGSVLSGIGSFSQAQKGDKAARKLAKRQFAVAQTAFTPVSISGPGGSFAGPAGGALDPQTGQPVAGGGFQTGSFLGTEVPQTQLTGLQFGLGDLDPIRSQLLGGAGGFLGTQQGLTPDVLASLSNLAGGTFLGDPGAGIVSPVIGGAAQGAGQAFGQFQNLLANPFQAGLQQQLFQQAGGAFGALPGTAEAARAQQLGLLREQAAPFEERAFQNLQQNLFSTGRLGTTGGALQTEAFARGLGQADIQRQLVAGGEGRAAGTFGLQQAQGFLGGGSGLAGLAESLLSGAGSRFQGLAGLTGNLQSQLFQNQLGLGQAQFGQLSNIAQQLQGAQTGFGQQGLAALGGVGALDAQGLQQLSLALQAAQAQANTRLGAAGVVQPTTNTTATALAQLSGALAPEGGAIPTLFQGLQGLFQGGGTAPAPVG